MNNKPNESDWKMLRAMVPELRERYLKERNSEVVAILTDESLSPTERFWNASQRVGEIAKVLTTCLDGHTRSRMVNCMLSMYHYKLLTAADLRNFSEELQEQVLRLSEL